MKFDPKQIREETSKDFEAAWMTGLKYMSERRLNERYPRSLLRLRCGKPYPVLTMLRHRL